MDWIWTGLDPISLGIEKRYFPLDLFPTDVTEIVGKLLSTDGAGLVTTEEGRVLPSLQTDVAQPSLVLLLLFPGLHRRLIGHLRHPVLNLEAAHQALLHSPAAIKARHLNYHIKIQQALLLELDNPPCVCRVEM